MVTEGHKGGANQAATKPVSSNTFPLEWPRGSGRIREFPEVDRGEFFGLGEARAKINPAQEPLIDRLVAELK